MNLENSKPKKPQKFVRNFPERLDLRSSNKHVALQKVSIHYTGKNMRKQFKKNKLKIIAPTLNDELELPDSSYSVSDIQDCIKHLIKKQETLTTIPPIHVYINRISNRLMFKIKDEYKLELQMPEIKKLCGSTKKIIKTNNGEIVSSLEVVEVALVR